jgi:alpha-beta hydrolase superfamily lysophospholipase
MLNQEGSFQTKDGLKLFTQTWLSEKKPKANIVIVHGLGEHAGRYAHVSEIFIDNRFNVFAFD